MISDHNSSVESRSDAVLSLARAAGQTRQFRIAQPHVSIRMAERGVTMKCISRALQTATEATHQPERDRWKLTGGVDVDGAELILIVKVDRGVLVVTVF